MQKNSVRRAQQNDLIQLTRLFDRHRMFNLQGSDVKGAEIFVQERLHQADSYIFVYQDEQNILNGFIQLYPILSSVCMRHALILNDLYVDEVFRNKGVATELMQAVIDFTRQQNFAWMELETGVDNFKAQALYLNMRLRQMNEIYRFNIDFSST